MAAANHSSSNGPLGKLFAELRGTEYQSPLEDIIRCHSKIWAHPQHPHFTRHGPEHAASVKQKLSAWLDGVLSLSQQDTFILLSAVYLHDIGMQCPSPALVDQYAEVRSMPPYGYTDLERIRRSHNRLSRAMIEDQLHRTHVCDWGSISTSNVKQEIFAVALLAHGHAGPLSDVPAELTSNYTNLPQPTNLLRLQYLLRIADAMDAHSHRVDDTWVCQRWPSVNPKDKFHCWKHWFVGSVDVTGAGVFTFHYAIPEHHQEWFDDISTCVEMPLRDGLARLGLELRQMGVWTLEVISDRTPRTNVHEQCCPFDLKTREFLQGQANDIRARRVTQPLTQHGLFDAYGPSMPTAQTVSSPLDEVEKVYVGMRCTQSVGDSAKGPNVLTKSLSLLRSGTVPLILGPYGSGKSFFAKRFLFQAKRILACEEKTPIPVSLREVHFAQEGLATPIQAVMKALDGQSRHPWSQSEFMDLARQGKLIFILDGLDEIPSVQAPDVAGACLSACLELASLGRKPNGVVITSRIGLLSNIPEPTCAPLYLQKWTPEDFHTYVYYCKAYLKGIAPRRLLRVIRGNDTLASLITTPLYARMLVEIAEHLCGSETRPIDEASLYEQFVWDVFQKHGGRGAFQDIDGKIECLMVIAAYLFERGISCDTIEALHQATNQMLGQDVDVLNRFFRTEIVVYSLMHVTADGRLTFSHETLREFFLARFLSRLWSLGCENEVEKRLAGAYVLSKCAIRFLIQMFSGKEGQLTRLARDVLLNSGKRRARAHGVLILIALQHDIGEVKQAGLQRSDLSGVRVSKAEFEDCDFTATSMSDSVFQECSFNKCIIRSVDVSGAEFRRCVFPGSVLSQLAIADAKPARFAGCSFKGSHIADSRYDNTKGLLRSCLDMECASFPGDRQLIRDTIESLKDA